jgi:hypothetical protein
LTRENQKKKAGVDFQKSEIALMKKEELLEKIIMLRQLK